MKSIDILNINEELFVFFNGGVYKFIRIEHYGNRIIGFSDTGEITFIYGNGKVCMYENYCFFANHIVVENNKLKGVYSDRGILLVPAKYDYISFMAQFIDCRKFNVGHRLYNYDGTLFIPDYASHICYCDKFIEVEVGNVIKKYSYEGEFISGRIIS